MKKTILYISFLFCCSLTAKSQVTTSLYVLGGVSTFEEKSSDLDFLYYPKPTGGIGFGVNFPLKNNFSLSSGINLQAKRGSYHYIEYLNKFTYDQYTTISIVSFSIPVAVGYTIPFKNSEILFGAGGYLGLNLFGANNTSQEIIYPNKEGYSHISSNSMDWAKWNEENNPERLKRIDYGYYFSMDYQYKRFIIGLNSEIGARNLSTYPSNELKFLTYSLMMKVGLKFTKKKKEVENK